MRKGFLISLILVFLVLLILIIPAVLAADYLIGSYCLDAEVSSIDPSSVGIGEEFTVGIQIDNCGQEVPKTVIFELKDLGPYITVKEPLETIIDNMGYSNSDRFLLYHMNVKDDAAPGDYLIKYKLTYGGDDIYIKRDGDFSITVTGEEAELSIASFKTDPLLPRKGETVELTLRIENTGDGTAKSVEVYTDHPFQGLKQSFIGALNSNEDGPSILTFIVDKSGEFEFPVTISYKDDFGPNEIKTNVSFNVLKKKSNIGAIILVMIIIIIFGGGVYYFLKTKKEKDRVIQQLLKGNNNNNNSSKKKKTRKNA